MEELIEKSRLKRAFPRPAVRRRLRERARLTQQDMAAALGVNRAAISRYESGQREPRGEILKRYLELINRLRLELAGEDGGQA